MKDSGQRLEFDSGMVRDTTEGKINYMLIRPGPMLKRWAAHLSRAASKYDNTRKPGEPRNWQLARGMAEYERFVESAARHFEQWVNGDRDEDHAAAIFFNVNGAEYVLEQMTETPVSARAVKGAINVFITRTRSIPYDTGEPCPALGCSVPGVHEGAHVLSS